MQYSSIVFGTVGVLALALISACGSDQTQPPPDFSDSRSVADFEQLPFVSNEKLGMFNYIHSISVTPPDDINSADWGPDIPFGAAAGSGAPGGAVNMHRYTIAFAGYGISMLAELTPAYRERHLETIDGIRDVPRQDG